MLPPGPPRAQAADVWTSQSTGTTVEFHAIAAVDAVTAWIVGAGGVIFKTGDGGTTWALQGSGVTANALNDVAAVDATTAWAVGAGGAILKTTNGGTTWTAQTSATTVALNSVAAVNATTAWVAGGSGVIKKTTDGGTTWTAQTSTTGFNLNDLAAVDASIAWAVGSGSGDARPVLRTIDGGTTWSAPGGGGPCGGGFAFNFTGVAATSSAAAFIVGEGGRIFKTSDFGLTWTAQTSNTTSQLNRLAALDGSTAWAVGNGGVILKTTDGASTWTNQTSNTTQNLSGVAAVSASVAWAVGAGGVILKSSAPPPPSNTAAVSQSFSVQAAAVSVSVSPPAVDYGPIALGGAAVSPSLTATNTGAGAENFLVQGSNAVHTVTGDNDWTLGPAPGVDIYTNSFGDAAAGPFTAMTITGSPLAASVAAAGTKSFFLQVKTPTSTVGNGVRNSTVTVIAVVP